jgi:tetratricopeptide (TPR) repeat protein
LQVIKQLMDQADDQMDANDFAGAAATIQEALHLDPNNQRARMAAEEKERKQRNFEQIRELQRQGEEAMEGGDPDKALALFDEALALAPESMHEQLCNASLLLFGLQRPRQGAVPVPCPRWHACRLSPVDEPAQMSVLT